MSEANEIISPKIESIEIKSFRGSTKTLKIDFNLKNSKGHYKPASLKIGRAHV